MKKNLLIGVVTDEQIAVWKKQHKTVYELIIDDAVCYLRKPTRVELAAATSVSGNDPYQFNEQLLNSCWLGGADIIKTDDGVWEKHWGTYSRRLPRLR